MRQPPEPRTASAVPALRRAVEVLDLLGHTSEPLAAADITRELGLPKSSAHGLIATMLELELVVRGADGRFRLGPRLMRWASGFLGQTNLTGEFQCVLAREADLDAHTVTLTVLDGREVVYVACRDSGDPLGLTFRIGMRLPAPYTATGKALLAAMPPGDLDRLFADPKSWPSPLTARGVGSLDQLRHELDLVRGRGYSLDDGEIREGMICVGAAIRDHSGRAIAGIAVSLIRSQASAQIIEKLGERVRSAADAITRQLGY